MVNLLKKIYDLHISKYIIVGVLNTIVGYSVYSLLILIDIKYAFALLISHIAGVINSYFWNKYYTFKSSSKNWHELKRFILIYILYYILNLLILSSLIELVSLHPLLGQALSLVVVTTFSFFAHKYWTFKR